MTLPRRSGLALVLLLALAGPARADTVILKDGRRIEGTVSSHDSKVFVRLRPGVEVAFDPSDVERIESGETLRETFEKKRADLVPGDPEPRYALAQWCKESKLSHEWREMLDEVLRLAPDHPQARRDLGYVRDGDRWILEEELRKKLGFEKLDGKWVPVAEARRSKRTAEVKKILLSFALTYPRGGPRAEQARAAVAALAQDRSDAELVAPLVEERLGEHDAGTRLVLVELLGKLGSKGSVPRLVALTFDDDDPDLRAAAARALWATGDVGGRTSVVQGLYHRKAIVRDRAAEALGAVTDPETVPYLIEALYLRGVRTVEVPEQEQTILRGGAGERGMTGLFGGYNAPVTVVSAGRVTLRSEEVFLYSKKVLAALQKITSKDYDFSKHDWFEWWEREGRAKLVPHPAAGAGPTGPAPGPAPVGPSPAQPPR